MTTPEFTADPAGPVCRCCLERIEREVCTARDLTYPADWHNPDNDPEHLIRGTE